MLVIFSFFSVYNTTRAPTIKELQIYFTLHNDVIRTFLRFLNLYILHLFEILYGANIHLFEIFCKSFDGKA